MKDFLQREFDELKRNKVRAASIGVCFIVVLIVLLVEDGSNTEEIVLEEPPPLTKDLPVKVLPIEKSRDGVKIVLGANADRLFVGDPFAVEEEPKPPLEPEPVVEPVLEPIPQIVIQPPPTIEEPKPKEQITLTGTAISGDNKTAMFLRGKETLFLTIGDEVGGKIILDISPQFVTFTDGERIYLQKELR